MYKLGLCGCLIRTAASLIRRIYGIPLPLQPKMKKITHITRNTKNRNFAIPADAAAIPPNPNTAAISAIIRKVTAQPNIVSPPCYRRIESTHCDGRVLLS
jgi:hypothetical protein